MSEYSNENIKISAVVTPLKSRWFTLHFLPTKKSCCRKQLATPVATREHRYIVVLCCILMFRVHHQKVAEKVSDLHQEVKKSTCNLFHGRIAIAHLSYSLQASCHNKKGEIPFGKGRKEGSTDRSERHATHLCSLPLQPGSSCCNQHPSTHKRTAPKNVKAWSPHPCEINYSK